MSALFDAVIESTPAVTWEVLADKFVNQDFVDPEFACAAFDAAAYVTAKGVQLAYPAVGSSQSDDEKARIVSAAAKILEHAGKPVEMNGPIRDLILAQALKLVMDRLKTVDWAKYITDLFSGEQQ